MRGTFRAGLLLACVVSLGGLAAAQSKHRITFKKAKKISRSVKRMESEISKIQIQMARIGKDLTTVLEMIQPKKKS